MKDYIRLPNGKLAIKKGSFLDKVIVLFPICIGYYEMIRIGPCLEYRTFSWIKPSKRGE